MEWIHAAGDLVPRVALTIVGIYLAVLVLTRLNGLRTYAKMSSFDFAITVAIGSVVAGTAVAGSSFLAEGVVALATLLLCQWIASWSRVHLGASALIDNTPVVLMVGAEKFEDAMAEARVTDADILAKLREANVLDFDEVQAVVLEATGDISVLHGHPDGKRLNPALLEGVRGRERIVRKSAA